MKKIFLIIIFILLVAASFSSAHAYIVETQIGNPAGEEPPPEDIPGDYNGEIAYWAKIISARLYMRNGQFNHLTDGPPITNRGYTVKTDVYYWCTRLIFDSYNLSGITMKKNTSVRAMLKWWNEDAQRGRGFRTIPFGGRDVSAQGVIPLLKPGDAIMRMKGGGTAVSNHVDMITKICIGAGPGCIDPRTGNGVIELYDSNAWKKKFDANVIEWRIKDPIWFNQDSFGSAYFGIYRN